MTAEYCDYLHSMTGDVANGMAFVVSNWEGDDSWLRKDRCTGSCSGKAVQTISNISITTGAGKPVKPSYKPEDYTFGDHCATSHDDMCGSVDCPSVAHCRWSWPNGKSFDDPNAACRCDVVSHGYYYH
mmetsp:Transcript_5500/g.7348  ORF Transcript_5500/g.7348 Transcript_5500/m.7348 type:complete len:128 (+) Transcript_5500:565-948(+)